MFQFKEVDEPLTQDSRVSAPRRTYGGVLYHQPQVSWRCKSLGLRLVSFLLICQELGYAVVKVYR